jgi:XTP/dITP diphosphohydrolase
MKQLKPGERIVVASHNKGKVWEINQLIAPYGLDAVSAGELGLPEPEETEPTFAGNAHLKAAAAAKGSGLPALADDSGLEVECLGGNPGIYSARWAGPGKDFGVAMQKVADAVTAKNGWVGQGPPANFISVLCLAWPDGFAQMFEGRVFGHLVWPARGGNGFGYDPMFVADGESSTFGEMEPAQKYAISHRTRAFEAFKAECLDHMQGSLAPRGKGISGRDLPALTAAAANLSTKDELCRFMSNLRVDLGRNKDAWKNRTLESYLNAVEGHLANVEPGAEPQWRTVAKALLAASGHD